MNRTASSDHAGYTLIEMVTVLVLLSILSLVPSGVILESMRVYSRTVPAMTASYHARTSMLRMKRELRYMEEDSITVFTASALTFLDSGSNSVAYALTAGNLTRNGDVMAEDVTSLTFTYWKDDGTTAAVAADLHLIEIDFTVENRGEPYRVQSAVFPRVLRQE